MAPPHFTHPTPIQRWPDIIYKVYKVTGLAIWIEKYYLLSSHPGKSAHTTSRGNSPLRYKGASIQHTGNANIQAITFEKLGKPANWGTPVKACWNRTLAVIKRTRGWRGMFTVFTIHTLCRELLGKEPYRAYNYTRQAHNAQRQSSQP